MKPAPFDRLRMRVGETLAGVWIAAAMVVWLVYMAAVDVVTQDPRQ